MYPKTATLEAVPAGITTNVKLTYTPSFTANKNILSIDIYSLSSAYISIDDYVEQARQGAHVECKANSVISQISDITLNGSKVKTFSIENCLSNNELSFMYYIENNNLITQITAKTHGLPDTEVDNRAVLEKIIRSFLIN